MKTTISILGRKTDLLLLIGIVALVVFIVLNTMCNCKCNKSAGSESCGSCDKKPDVPVQPSIVGANANVFEGDLAY